jgi:hypothetical protein
VIEPAGSPDKALSAMKAVLEKLRIARDKGISAEAGSKGRACGAWRRNELRPRGRAVCVLSCTRGADGMA